MNALGAICFLALFGVYAIGQECSRRAMGLKGDSFWIRFHQAARQPFLGLLFGLLLILLYSWSQDRMAVSYNAFCTTAVIVLLIALVRAVELPPKNK